MKVYHLGKTKFGGDLTGKGAELYGGRWNRPGFPCIYTSGTRSLALLEYAVNNSLDNIPRALSFTIYEIPGDSHFKPSRSSLPGNWTDRPTPISSMDFGTRILKENKYLILALPSVVIPQEFNYIINPNHKDFQKIKVVEIKDFVFDVRVKT